MAPRHTVPLDYREPLHTLGEVVPLGHMFVCPVRQKLNQSHSSSRLGPSIVIGNEELENWKPEFP